MALFDKFDNLRDKLVATGKDVSEKAKETAAIAKLQTQISVERNKLKGLYTDLGKAYYENPEDEIIETYKASIDAIMEIVDSYEKELADMKGMKTCVGCGTSMDKEVLFCSKCGTKNEIPVEPVEEVVEEAELEIVEAAPAEPEKKVCPVCEAEVTEDMAFCEVCGSKLED